MSVFVLPALVGLTLLTAFLLALAGYSLRDFSRSRLYEICRRRGRERRFGTILRRHEDALIISELLLVLVVVVLVLGVVRWLRFDVRPFEIDGVLEWLAYLGEALLAVLGLLAAVAVLPWSLSRVAGERFLFRFWPIAAALASAGRPALMVLRRFDALLHRLVGVEERDNGDAEAMTEEIQTVVEEAQREGVIKSQARTMIQRVIELKDEDVAAIMTPRTEMVCIPVDSSLEEARRRLLEAGHSRVPVVGESTDDVVGVLYAKDLLRHLTGGERQVSLREIVREPFYVPETTGIDRLLEMLRRKRVHLAIVVDEYGGVAGLVSLEDVLEEIVGEIADEFDAAEGTGIYPVSEKVTEVESRVHIDDLNEQFGYNLPEDGDYETIGGFVVMQLGRIPRPNETVTSGDLKITVLAADERKVHRLRIERQLQTAAAGATR